MQLGSSAEKRKCVPKKHRRNQHAMMAPNTEQVEEALSNELLMSRLPKANTK